MGETQSSRFQLEKFGENSNLRASIAANAGRTQTYVPTLLKMRGQIHDFTQF